MVLCESFGTHTSAQGLNGANMNLEPGVPEMTMESLVYLRTIEPSFHDLVEAEYRAKRKTGVPFIDFNDRAERTRHRWFADMYKDIKQRNLNTYVDAIHNIGQRVSANDDDDDSDTSPTRGAP